MSTVYRATVTRIDGEGVFVEIPAMGVGVEFGPCAMLPIRLAVEDRVLVANINDVQEDIVIIGPLVEAVPEEPTSLRSLYYYTNAAARDSEQTSPRAGDGAFLETEQKLTIYSTSGTPGWRQFSTS